MSNFVQAGSIIPNDMSGLVSPLMTTAEAAAYLKVSPKTMEGWRVRGGGPCFRKMGGAVRYHIDELNEFMDANVKFNTSK